MPRSKDDDARHEQAAQRSPDAVDREQSPIKTGGPQPPTREELQAVLTAIEARVSRGLPAAFGDLAPHIITIRGWLRHALRED